MSDVSVLDIFWFLVKLGVASALLAGALWALGYLANRIYQSIEYELTYGRDDRLAEAERRAARRKPPSARETRRTNRLEARFARDRRRILGRP